jgi:AcrR family transcriptional regulator
MARRSDHSREELTELIIASATRLVAENGLGALSARTVAAEIGYSPGTLYNLFESIDKITLEIAMRTLKSMLAEGQGVITVRDPRGALRQLARFYLSFTRRNNNLWHVVVTRRWHDRTRLSPEFLGLVSTVLGVVEYALEPLFAAHEVEAKRTAALTLWASMEGISSVSGASGLVSMPEHRAMYLAETLIDAFVLGLERDQPSFARPVAAA